MHRLVRGLVSLVLGSFVGFSLAFIVSPDPTGVVPVVAGSVLTVLLTAVFYVGIGTVTSSDPA